MRVSRLPLALIASGATMTFSLAASAATSPKTLNVCSLSSAAAATAVTGISSKCTNAPSSPGPGSTAYEATWAGKSKSERLQVTVDVYTSNAVLSLAKKNLAQGFPGGRPSKLSGVGSGAYQASAAGAAAIHFSAGSDIVLISLTMTGSTPKVSTSLISFAKSIASKITPPAKRTVNTTHVTSTTTASGSLSGNWSGTYNGAFSGTFTLAWQESGSHLSGTISVSSLGDSPTSVTGTVQGSKITFGTVGSQAIQYTGTSSGSTMSGTWTLGPSGGSWSAHKS